LHSLLFAAAQTCRGITAEIQIDADAQNARIAFLRLRRSISALLFETVNISPFKKKTAITLDVGYLAGFAIAIECANAAPKFGAHFIGLHRNGSCWNYVKFFGNAFAGHNLASTKSAGYALYCRGPGLSPSRLTLVWATFRITRVV
jgi:hypothetical protein